MKNTTYVLSLILLFIATYLIIEFPASGRMGLIAGMLFSVGLVLNIIGYALPMKSKNKG
jgi:hypothetical protein